MASIERRRAAIIQAVETVHGWPLGMHRATCQCEAHKSGESVCPCKYCVAIRAQKR